MRRYILLSYFSYRFINPAFLVLSFMLENDIQIIIMAGGVGSRFWPMSIPDYPKQFVDVMGVGRSLIQLTVDRLKPNWPVTLIINTSEYQRVLSKALSYTSDKNAIVAIGIKPSHPKTGYGYIVAA